MRGVGGPIALSWVPFLYTERCSILKRPAAGEVDGVSSRKTVDIGSSSVVPNLRDNIEP